MDQNKNINSEQLTKLRDIRIAKIAFVGASIATIGDGIAALAAGLALDALEDSIDQRSPNTSYNSEHFEIAQRNLDHYINELIQLRKLMR